MSEKTTGYRLEYASSNRAKCKGPKPCSGTTINKGDLRFGTLVEVRGNQSFAWRHWGCVTPKLIENIKKNFSEASELDGFEDLNDDDKAKVLKAYEDGHVADEDIPDSARKPEGEEKPKKKAGAQEGEGLEEGKSFPLCLASLTLTSDPLKQKAEAEAEGGEETEKPKKAARPKSKKAEEGAAEEKPKSKSATTKKATEKKATETKEKAKAAPKKRASKKAAQDEESGEDFTEVLAAVKDDEEDEEPEEEKPKKKAPAKKAAAEKKEKDKPVSKKAAKADEDVDMADGTKEDAGEETNGKKRKRAPAPKSATKPPSKKAKPASKAKKTKEPAEEAAEEEAE
ncbi:PARP-type zinc finger-containing protein C2A9.07c [Leucoagaricus sp. SymC.cos]|nr:PARP-type zinc finger-containing protein C2A9.07c [Leucoagaricus sp. SymC.cos]